MVKMSKSVENPNQTSQATSNESSAQWFQHQLMQQQLLMQNNQQQNQQDDEIDLAELWRAIWAGKFTIIIISLLFAVASVFFALSKPNIYKASTILAPASSEGGAGGLGALAGQFGGLASMAGINLGGGGSDKTALAIEILKSRAFIENFIKKYQLLVPLMASKNWDVTTDTLILNDKLYNSTTNKWLREVKAPRTPQPTSWESFKSFMGLLNVSQDKTTSMVNIDLAFYSPTLAKQWLTWLVADINEYMREQDQREAQASIDYLTEQLSTIKVASMETVFYQLIEEQTKNMMLTRVSKEYVLKTIDPPQVPDTKDKPKRALIVVLGTMLGGILSVLIVLIRYFSRKER
jgi:uncharacterized protein involved in exopolysaccharide biosynthesis